MKQSAFDRWLTTQPSPQVFIQVTQDALTNYEEGLSNPQHIDELSCVVCDDAVGWCSTGSFTDFFTDDSDSHNLCIDCHDTMNSNDDE